MDVSQPESDCLDVKSQGENSSSDSRLTRPWLESLSTAELVKLADSFGIDIPSTLERVFIIEELLGTALGSKRDSEDDLETSADFTETVALPKQYNISFIEVMIRDPLWAFVFWEIKEHDRKIYENAPDFEGYCLRVIPAGEGEVREDSFTVLVDVNDTARYLGFPAAENKPENAESSPEHLHPDRRYIVKLCAKQAALEAPLAVSRPFTLPTLFETPGRNNDLYQNPCICLSGLPDFSVIKTADRQFRAKRL